MTYLNELKELIVLHAQAQGLTLSYCKSILDRISREEGNSPSSWVYEWSKEAERLKQKARWLEATSLYNIARFPFVQSPERKQAHFDCVESCTEWLLTKPQIQKININTTQGAFNVYFTKGLGDKKRPLLVVLGGIVSIKEQWVTFLEKADALDMAVAVTEMPRVGENTLAYGVDAGNMFSVLLEHLKFLADVNNTYVVAMSFSGHMAIQYALRDPRIKSITTVGAPIHYFFRDRNWWEQVPLTTKRTLAHLLALDIEDVFPALTPMALEKEQLQSLSIPLNYIFSRRDEIIPSLEKQFLQKNVKKLNLQEFDDVHGSPNHLQQMQLWVPMSILSQRPKTKMKAEVLRWLFYLKQTKGILKLGA
ncbi:MAG: alpha/beta hydrolase [Xenococcaceae cyanobacterium MO_167.B27]|nr:alpha/beta hydrolase [Xenococcaceae cyanobacterium MO_167.B27]